MKKKLVLLAVLFFAFVASSYVFLPSLAAEKNKEAVEGDEGKEIVKIGQEKKSDKKQEYDKMLSLEKARELAGESRKARKVEIDLERADIGVNMARSHYKDMKELEEDMDDAFDDILPVLFGLRRVAEGEEEEFINSMIHSMLDFEDEDIVEDMKTEAERDKREAKQQRDLAYKEWENVGKEQLKFGAESMYVGILTLKAQKEALNEGLISLGHMLEQEKARLKEGKSIDLKVDAIKLQKDELENDIKSIKNRQKELEREFLNFINLSQDKPVYLTPVSFDLEAYMEKFELEKAQEYVLEEGEEIKLAEKELEHARDNMEWAEDEYAYSTNQYRMAELDLEEAKLDYEETEDELEMKLHENHNSFIEAMEDLKLAKDALLVESESVRSSKIQLEEGMITKRDYLDSVSELEAAKKQKEMAKFQAYLAKRQLMLMEEGIVVEGAGELEPGETPGEMEPDNVEAVEELEFEGQEGASGFGVESDHRKEK